MISAIRMRKIPHRRQSSLHARPAAPGADPIGHPENPARLRQIAGVNGGNGVGRPCRAASLTRIDGANLP